MSEVKQLSSMDQLFDASIDDLADLPAFETPPAGSYVLTVTLEAKEVNKKPAVEASYVVNDTIELADANATPVADGTKSSMVFFIDNEFGLGNLKKFLKPFAEHFGTGKIGELVRDHVKDVQVACQIKTRADKNDPEKIYGSLVNITIA